MKKRNLLLTFAATLMIAGQMAAASQKELSIFSIHLGKAFDGTWPVYKKAAEITGTELKGIASKNQTDQVQAYNLMLSSGNLPDIIAYEKTEDLEKLGMEGGLIPLDKLIEEHAPNIKAFWEKYPRYKKDAVAANGKIYIIPNYYDYYNWRASQGYFIRKDWLNKLGLDEPKTIEDFYNVMKAFKTQDPNGNGKNDEIPFFVRADIPRKVFIALIDMFQVEPGWYERDGQVVYGPASDDYKKAIKEIAKWYKEGLIDPEIFTRGLSSRDYMLSNNLGGVTNDWFASTSSYNAKLRSSIPGFDFTAVLPPEYNGKRVTTNSRNTHLGGWGISSTSKNAVDAIKYFDFWYSEAGRRLWNFGVEGNEWEMKEGTPKFTDHVLNNPDGKTPLAVLYESGAQFRLGMPQDAEYERQWSSPEALAAVDLYIKNNALMEPMPVLKYNQEETREFIRVEEKLKNYTEEMAQKWIMGSSDIEKDWDTYIKRLESIGLKKAGKIQQTVYDRFMKN